MWLTYDEVVCVDTPNYYQSYNRAFYKNQAENLGTLVTSLVYALN